MNRCTICLKPVEGVVCTFGSIYYCLKCAGEYIEGVQGDAKPERMSPPRTPKDCDCNCPYCRKREPHTH